MQNLATGLLAAALLVIAPRAQTPPTATLIANQPIVAQWVNAPLGTPGAYASQPAGPLTSANVVAGNAGVTWARFSCNLTQGNQVHFTALNSVSPPGSLASVTADLTLVLTVAVGETIELDVSVTHGGDTPDPQGFRVDVGDDGSIELDSSSTACCSTEHLRKFTRMPASGVLPIHITVNQASVPPQGYGLTVTASTWAAGTTSLAADCGGTAAHNGSSGNVVATTNYQVAALPSMLPNTMAKLKAIGSGLIGVFLVADQAAASPVQLPTPFTATCELLVNAYAVPGTVTRASSTISGLPVQWAIDVPTLPPGLVFYVQHASVDLVAPYFFGSTNRIRVQT